MSDKYIRIYFYKIRAERNFRFIHDLATHCELSFTHPKTSEFLTWSASESAKAGDLSKIQEACATGGTLAFQMWWSECEDLFCTVHSSGTFDAIDLFLSGVSQNHLERLQVVLQKMITSDIYTNDIAALIVDTDGSTANIPWDTRLMQGFDANEPLPVIMMISTSLPAYNKLNRSHYGEIVATDTIARVVPIS
ncbi:hypothetical protein [Tuwongella immobilis]|uniref:Uncharacterized protein n=1 Tax=Tuwongella immobilis TaxID=692036 RepID=A0A6C2YH61_9BACT|nr:hypothetical protein [Tuwongella immobilis]VIP00826.1 unnamed protein product [Tuwongella immobilis]VTR97070.1 unnamed protein product [Tuwongella immobilis]